MRCPGCGNKAYYAMLSRYDYGPRFQCIECSKAWNGGQDSQEYLASAMNGPKIIEMQRKRGDRDANGDV